MGQATRLDTDMSGWVPDTTHYAVPDGHLAVTVANFLTAKGTTVFRCNAGGIAESLDPVAVFDDGTTAEAALAALGYTVA